MTDETKKLFINYFNDGMTPSAAKNFHALKLINQQGDDLEATKQLADSQVNPKEREIYGIFDEWRKGKYGSRNFTSIVGILQERKSTFEERGVSIYINKDPFVVLILTPIMKRAHEQEFSKEICFVDSSGSCDQMSTVITFIIGVSKIGGIPLACLLHTSQTEDNYRLIFQILRQYTPHGFGGNGEPKIFMTDDSSAERNALQNVYPQATLLLCTFHICQAVWRWLWDSRNQIDKNKRRKLMTNFRYIIFAQTEEECEEYYNTLISSCEYVNFVNYIKCLWIRKTEWCHWYRKSLSTRGYNTNNFVEASIRVVKDIILERCKAFNAIALLDFMAFILENYHKRRLISYASSRHTKNDLRYLKLKKQGSNLVVKEGDDGTYLVSSSTDPHLFYTVIAKGSLCDCVSGSGGAICKHLSAVQDFSGLKMSTCPLLTEADKNILVYLATGERNNSFFRSMQNQFNGSDPLPMTNLTNDFQSQEILINLADNHNNPQTINEEHKSAVADLKSELNRISNLAESQTCTTDLIRKFTNALKKTNTGSQLDSFFCNQETGDIETRKDYKSATNQKKYWHWI